jgi:hypothetical protein
MGEDPLSRLLTICTTLVAAAATATALALPASASTAHPAAAPAPQTQVISLGGHAYPTGPLLAAQKDVVMNATTTEITVLPGARTTLPASTYSELTSLVAALNAADTTLRSSAAKALAATPAASPAISKIAASPCTNRFRSTWGSWALTLYIPDCMAYGFAAAVGGPAAVASFLFSEIGPLSWAAALVVASAILTANAVLAAWAGFCDIFGPGNGVIFTWEWKIDTPEFGCW